MIRLFPLAVIGSLLFLSYSNTESSNQNERTESETSVEADSLRYEYEVHLKNIRQLTFGGENAEAYWSFSNDQLIFQRTAPSDGYSCDQIFTGTIPPQGESFDFNLISTGKGRTTCSYFLPGDSMVLYASTHLSHDSCPPVPDHSMGYVWPLYSEFEIFISDRDRNIVEQLTDNTYYDAEATVSPTENKIVYTSTKSGDLEIYVLDLDTREEIQITSELGYDGGAFFSPDGQQLVWRASRPESEEEKEEYIDLLEKNLVKPSDMELFISNIDGSGIRQITNLGGANWAPFFHPSGEKILFCSNHKTQNFPFNIFMVDIETGELEQITYDSMFDSFPMFSYDGKHLVFSSNRNNGGTRHTNLFVAEWVD